MMTLTINIENPDRLAEVMAALKDIPEVRISPRPSYEGLHIMPSERPTLQEFQASIEVARQSMKTSKGVTSEEILADLGIV